MLQIPAVLYAQCTDVFCTNMHAGQTAKEEPLASVQGKKEYCIIVCDWQCFHSQQQLPSYPFHSITARKPISGADIKTYASYE
jgi:hypothetical protein